MATSRRRISSHGAAAAIVLLILALASPLLISAQSGPATANTISSSSSSSSKATVASSSTGKACAKSGDPACVSCTKGKNLKCLACSSTGAVPAEIGAKGRCVCPAGSAVSTGGSGTTTPTTTGGASPTPAHSSSKKKSAPKSIACNPCAPGYYAPLPQPVATSKCKPCPEHTTVSDDQTTCLVDPGFALNSATGVVEECEANKWCPGGDVAAEGRVVNACPSGATSPAQSDEFSDCLVAPGRVYDPDLDKVVLCSKDSWCEGGSAADAGQIAHPCPTGTTTPSTGASAESQCTVPPGSVYNPTTETVSVCTPGFWCPGGSIASTGLQQDPCTPPGTTSPAGSSSPSQCTPATCAPGFYTTSTTSVPLTCIPCGVNHVCPGTPDPTIRTACPLGTDTAGLTTASSSSQCVVSTCNPCGTTASPTTYFTTGSSRQVYVNAALDPTTATNPPTAGLLCTMPTNTPEFSDTTNSAINDVAATSTGQLLIAGRPGSSNAAGFILLLHPAAQTPGGTCTYTKLLDIAPAVAGLGAGPKSNLFVGTGGSAFIYTYQLSETDGVVSLTPVGTADVSATIGGAIGASDITAVPNDPTKAYFTTQTDGYVISLDSNGNPIAGTESLMVSGGIGLSAPAAWCNSVSAFAGSSGTNNAYSFVSSGNTFTNVGETTMPVNGLSGAATVPVCA